MERIVVDTPEVYPTMAPPACRSIAWVERLAIFDAVTRTDARPSLHAESRYHFYNRAAGPVFDRVRLILDAWLEDYPAAGRADLRGRFRSSSDAAFSSAFWELYLFQSLTRMGFTVEPHPEIPLTSRRPDFHAHRPGEVGFYLEATLASPSTEDRASDRVLGSIYDLLNDLPTPNFLLDVEVERRGDRPPTTRQLRQDLLSWLANLDPDDVMAAPGGWISLDPFQWNQSGWTLLFRPIPKSPGHRGRPGRAIGVNTDQGVQVIDTSSGVRRAIKEKAGRYGRLDRPYVIAILIEDPFTDGEAIVDALYGTVSFRFDPSPGVTLDPQPFRQPDGPWMSATGATNSRVSAVVTAANLAPAVLTRVAPHLWHNPWAVRPLVDRFDWKTSRVEDAVLLDREASISLLELLDLPPDWPGPEDPFPRT